MACRFVRDANLRDHRLSILAFGPEGDAGARRLLEYHDLAADSSDLVARNTHGMPASDWRLRLDHDVVLAVKARVLNLVVTGWEQGVTEACRLGDLDITRLADADALGLGVG